MRPSVKLRRYVGERAACKRYLSIIITKAFSLKKNDLLLRFNYFAIK